MQKTADRHGLRRTVDSGERRGLYFHTLRLRRRGLYLFRPD